MGFYEEMIRRIAADADPEACIEDIRIYANWVLVKTGKWSLSTYFHNMPGFIDSMGMDTWMGNWIGRPRVQPHSNFWPAGRPSSAASAWRA